MCVYVCTFGCTCGLYPLNPTLPSLPLSPPHSSPSLSTPLPFTPNIHVSLSPLSLSAPNLPKLNSSQMFAIKNVLQCFLGLIHCPPGTRKTVTSVSIVYNGRIYTTKSGETQGGLVNSSILLRAHSGWASKFQYSTQDTLRVG